MSYFPLRLLMYVPVVWSEIATIVVYYVAAAAAAAAVAAAAAAPMLLVFLMVFSGQPVRTIPPLQRRGVRRGVLRLMTSESLRHMVETNLGVCVPRHSRPAFCAFCVRDRCVRACVRCVRRFAFGAAFGHGQCCVRCVRDLRSGLALGAASRHSEQAHTISINGF